MKKSKLKNVFQTLSPNDKDYSENVKRLRSQMLDIDGFDMAEVLGVAFCNDNIIDSLSTKESVGYHAIPDMVYKMALNNLSRTFNSDKELKSQLIRLRSQKRITEIKNKIVNLDIFRIAQVLSIACLKNSENVVYDFIDVHTAA